MGLGDLGPLASKPDAEAKSALFKKLAGVDCVDLCIDEKNPDNFINIVKCLAPSFGAICLGGIRSPDCFKIEKSLK